MEAAYGKKNHNKRRFLLIRVPWISDSHEKRASSQKRLASIVIVYEDGIEGGGH